MANQPRTHHLDVPGGRLHYEVRGSGPLLLVIGQPMTAEPFGPLADQLAEDRTVVTYDPHGLGRSTVDDPSQPVTPEVQADDLALLVQALDGGPAEVVGSSGGAVAALAFATRHPDRVGTVVAHEPPVTELLPDARYVRAAVDDIEDAFRAAGSGAAWGAFVSLVVLQGPVGDGGVPPAGWPPPGQPTPEGEDAEQQQSPARTAKQQADDELFFLRMLKPFTRYQPDVAALRSIRPRVVIAVGETSADEVAVRSTRVLAERLGVEPVPFPGDHGGFMAEPAAFAERLRRVLAEVATG